MRRLDRQLLRQFGVAANADDTGRAFGEADFFEGLGIDHGVVVQRAQIADVDDVINLVPSAVAETTLWNAAEKRHLTAFEREKRLFGAGASILAFGAARGRFAHAAADAAADPLFLRPFFDADMYC